jgi:hypothetical protein
MRLYYDINLTKNYLKYNMAPIDSNDIEHFNEKTITKAFEDTKNEVNNGFIYTLNYTIYKLLQFSNYYNT